MRRMKKSLTGLLLLSVSIVSYSVGGIEVLTNTTPTSAANPAQQAAISAEAVFYNPAGSAFLEDGNHLYYGGYIVGTDYETRVEGRPTGTAEFFIYL